MTTDPIVAGPLPTELVVLGVSILLLLVHIQVQGATVTSERGAAWNIGPRDDAMPPLGRMAGRAQRALSNFSETWPAFIALSLALTVVERTGGLGAIGATVWLAARVLYLPCYMFGLRYWRTGAFLISLTGILMMLSRLFLG